MTKKSTKLIFIVIACAQLAIYACSNSSSLNGSGEKDTVVFQVGDDDDIDWMLFKYVKNNNYSPVYKFQESTFDDYGNQVWEDWWVIDDFDEDEFNEMKKYKDYSWYYDKVLNESSQNKKYTLKNIRIK
jgi:hypothetical protein